MYIAINISHSDSKGVIPDRDLKFFLSLLHTKNNFSFLTMKFTAKSNNEKDFISKGGLIPYAIKFEISKTNIIKSRTSSEKVG